MRRSFFRRQFLMLFMVFNVWSAERRYEVALPGEEALALDAPQAAFDAKRGYFLGKFLENRETAKLIKAEEEREKEASRLAEKERRRIAAAIEKDRLIQEFAVAREQWRQECAAVRAAGEKRLPGQLGWNSEYDGWLYSSDDSEDESGGDEHEKDCRDAAGGADEDAEDA